MTVQLEISQIIQDGRAAALAGDTFIARERFRRATELDSDSVEAWLGLSSVVPRLAEKREYLQRILVLDPGNAEAEASLQYVDKLIAEGLQLAPSKRREEHIVSSDSSSLLSTSDAPRTATEVEYCYRHPDRETGLHCIQCNRPICGECAEVTSVGQLCPECRRGRRPRNYQVSAGNILAGGIVAAVVAAAASFGFLLIPGGFFIFLILFLVGPIVAEFIVRAVDMATKAKRGRPMQVAVGVGIVLGTLPLLVLSFNITLLVFMIVEISMSVARLK